MGTNLLNHWKTASASVTGRSHEDKGTVCQDSVQIERGNDVLTVAVADGAGSAIHADTGSQKAVQCMCDLFTNNFDDLFSMKEDELKWLLIDIVLDVYNKTAMKMNINLNDLSSTLLFVAIKDDRYIAGNLGDGVVGYQSNSEFQVLFHPRNGEFANETYFVTSKYAVDLFEIRKGELDDTTGFILMTDGPSSLLYKQKERELAPACNTMSTWLDEYPADFVSSELAKIMKNNFPKKTTDDCTVALLKKLFLESLWVEIDSYVNYNCDASTANWGIIEEEKE